MYQKSISGLVTPCMNIRSFGRKYGARNLHHRAMVPWPLLVDQLSNSNSTLFERVEAAFRSDSIRSTSLWTSFACLLVLDLWARSCSCSRLCHFCIVRLEAKLSNNIRKSPTGQYWSYKISARPAPCWSLPRWLQILAVLWYNRRGEKSGKSWHCLFPEEEQKPTSAIYPHRAIHFLFVLLSNFPRVFDFSNCWCLILILLMLGWFPALWRFWNGFIDFSGKLCPMHSVFRYWVLLSKRLISTISPV